MKSGSTRAMGQNRKNRALKLLLPLLAFTLLLGFGPQAGVSYAEPSEGTGTTTSPVPATDPSGDPAATPADTPAGTPSSSTQENAPTSGQQAPAQPSTKPVKAPSGSVDLASFLTGEPKLFYGGAELTKDEEGNYTIHPDTPYKLQLGFQETPAEGLTPGNQFPIDGTTEMVFQLPEKMQAFPIDKPIEFSIEAPRGTVPGNKYWVKDNQIHVIVAKDDALKASSQTSFFVSLDVKFAKDAENIDLNDGVHMKVKISNNPDLTITKSARHDFAAGKVFYTLTVTSIDTNENVVISDQIQGDKTALHLDKDLKAFKIKSTNKKSPKPGEPQFGDNGFTLTIPKMTHGEQVTVEYSASVDYSKINPDESGTVEQTTNKANVISDQIPAPKQTENNLEHKLKIGSMVKNAGAPEETGDKTGIYTQPWTLKVNEYRRLNVKGYTIKDSIPGEYTGLMKYAGDGLTLKVNKGEKDADGNPVIEERKILWADLGISDPAAASAWEYKLPDSDPDKTGYEISYKTTVNVNDKIVPTPFSNQASSENPINTGNPEEVTTPTTPLKPPHIFDVEKKALKVDKEQVKW